MASVAEVMMRFMQPVTDKVGEKAGQLKEYYIDQPADVGMEAYHQAGLKYGKSGEWSKADAAKHMAWQGALAQRTGIPISLLLGLGKEIVTDGLGSLGNYAMGKGGNPVDTWKNSLMDIRNNSIGATKVSQSPDIVADAVRRAGLSTSSPLDSVTKSLPYSKY